MVMKNRLTEDGQHPTFIDVPKLLYQNPLTLKDNEELSEWLTVQTLFEGGIFEMIDCMFYIIRIYDKNSTESLNQLERIKNYPILGKYFEKYTLSDIIKFVSSDLCRGYHDVFTRDCITYFGPSVSFGSSDFEREESNWNDSIMVHVAVSSTGDYLGHVYSWTDFDEDSSVYVQLIRRSFRNLVDINFNGKKKISFVVPLLREVRKFHTSVTQVRILEPLPNIIQIITANFDADEYNFTKNNLEQDVCTLFLIRS